MMKTIKCSNCDKDLLEIDESFSPKDKIFGKCVASCCYCDDKSYKFDMFEKSHIRGISKIEVTDQFFDTADLKNIESNITFQYKAEEIKNVTSFVGMSKDKDGIWVLKTQKS